MLRPVALSLAPSCHDAISWSSDGELAIAAGEYFQVLTPKKGKDDDPAPNPANQDWHMARVRANLFTNSEWPIYLPGNRDDFSVAADLSESIVIGLAWSPAGLGKYRRSVLAVLTSNLVLSIWEPVGLKQQWTRVSIVNHIFWPQLQPSQDPSSHIFRKANIRSFTWCESLKPSTPAAGSSLLYSSQSRWGIPLLTVVNDLNEVIMLRVGRSGLVNNSSRPYDIQILARQSLRDHGPSEISPSSGSLFEKAVKERERTTALSCGPWQMSPATRPGNFGRAIATMAAVCGTHLRFIKIEITIGSSLGQMSQHYTLATNLMDHPLSQTSEKWAHRHITGPLRWLHTGSDATVSLAVGAMAAFITLSMSLAMYTGSNIDFDSVECHEWPLHEPETEENSGHQLRHLEPISAIISSTDEQTDTCLLQLGTLGGLGLITRFHLPQRVDSLQRPKWKHMAEDFQEDYDLENDLGGMTVSRIWGLTTYRNITAAIFTSHPTDMIEYRITSDDRSMIVFSEEGERMEEAQSLFLPQISDDQEARHSRIGEVIRFLLPGGDGDIKPDIGSQRLLYAAACRTIVGEEDKGLRAYAQRSLERLAMVTGADLREEMSKCDSDPSPIPAKTMDQLSRPGGQIYERCEVCDAGIGWPSALIAQCANGHRWDRCGLSFLAIQEPGISKYCAVCRAEALDEELVVQVRGGEQGQTFNALFEMFDICLGCASKFQATY